MNPNLLTLLIPTYNRPKLLFRALNFYSQAAVKCRIIIADSSDSEILENNKEVVKLFSDRLDITYSPSLPSEPVLLKVIRAIEKVDTEYLVFCADDDILNPAAAGMAVKFLSEHEDYSVCYGYFLAYQLNAQHPSLAIFPDFSCNSIEDESGLLRWLKLMSSYSATNYGVRRTSQVLAGYHSILKYFPCQVSVFGNMIEIFDTSLVCINGKTKRLPVLYSLRKGWPPSPAWEILIPHRNFSTHYASMRKCISSLLFKDGPITRKDARQIFDASFTNYLRTAIAPTPILKKGSAFDILYCNNEANRFVQAVSVEDLLTSAGDVFLKMKESVMRTPDEVDSRAPASLVEPPPPLFPDLQTLTDSELLASAEQSFFKSDYEQTEECCRALLTRSPETHGGWALLGRLSFLTGDFDYSIDLFRQALDLKPENRDYLQSLAESLFLKGNFEEALSVYQGLLQSQPASSIAWLGLAKCYSWSGRHTDAQHSFNQAIHFSANRLDTVRIKLHFTIFLIKCNQLKEAVEHLGEAISLIPDS